MRLLALQAFDDNYIWALVTDDRRAVIVDPGDAGPVIAAAERDPFTPTAILLTHHHNDHIGGTEALLQRWPGLPVFAPEDPRIDVPGVRTVSGGERIEIEGLGFDVIAVPGHTRSHVAFHHHVADDGLLFCGDTLFSLGCGRLFEGTAAQMHDSLSRLAALPATTRVCCGHEYTLANAAFARVVDPDNPALQRRIEEAQAMRRNSRPTLPSALGDERDCNPFLRCDQPAVMAAVATRLGHRPGNPVETFAELRRWKDGFRA